MAGPAYRIETERLVIRCWNPADAAALHRTIGESLEHLKPSMPWAYEEPLTLDQRIERLRGFRAQFDRSEDFIMGIFLPDESRVIGGTGLHTRVGPDAREIGYWIHVDFVRRGLCTESSAALTRVAFEVDGVKRVEIRCAPDNAASAAVAKRLGFRHEATLSKRFKVDEHTFRDQMVWTMFAEEFPASAAARVKAAAFDAAGRKLL
ncbi:MAG TPA: GNAT family protein [bacterium]|nr:GNAT family protein [bacterium]